MASPAIADEVYMVRVFGSIENQEYVNVLHFQCVVNNADIIEQLLVVMWLCFVQQLIPRSGANFELRRITAMRVAPTVGPEIEYAGVSGQLLVGQAAGDSLPSFCSAVIGIRSERAGKRGIGRFALAGVPELATVGSFISIESDYWDAINDFIACVADKFLGRGSVNFEHKFALGVLSRKSGALKPPYAVNQFSTSTFLRPSRKIGTIKSRQIGRGR